MGQQQLLLVILGVIVVGIAIGVGITQFSAGSAQANKDGLTSSLVSLSSNAYQYRIRPSTLGGGGNSYVNYVLSSRMVVDDYGTYSVLGTPSTTQIQLEGVSSINSSWRATCAVDSNGRARFDFSGW